MIDKDLGFILRKYDFRETSVLAHIYTRKFGKIIGLFKGFYTFKKEFSTSLDLFTFNEFIFYPRRSEIWLVSFADLVDDYSYLRKDVSKNIAAAVFMRLIDEGMALGDSNEEMFYLLKYSLESLRAVNPRKLLYIFLIKFLTISGFKPEFSLCINCHRPYSSSAFFSVSSGGLICLACKGSIPDICSISRETVSTISYLQHHNFPQLLRIHPSARCEKEVFFILQKFLSSHMHFNPFPEYLMN